MREAARELKGAVRSGEEVERRRRRANAMTDGLNTYLVLVADRREVVEPIDVGPTESGRGGNSSIDGVRNTGTSYCFGRVGYHFAPQRAVALETAGRRSAAGGD